jgi:hypothetical protein
LSTTKTKECRATLMKESEEGNISRTIAENLGPTIATRIIIVMVRSLLTSTQKEIIELTNLKNIIDLLQSITTIMREEEIKTTEGILKMIMVSADIMTKIE